MTPDPDELTPEQLAIAQQAALAVSPQPVPTAINVVSVPAPDGSPLVMLQIQSPTGIAVFFLDRDSALNLASHIRKTAQTGPKLVPAPPGLVIPR